MVWRSCPVSPVCCSSSLAEFESLRPSSQNALQGTAPSHLRGEERGKPAVSQTFQHRLKKGRQMEAHQLMRIQSSHRDSKVSFWKQAPALLEPAARLRDPSQRGVQPPRASPGLPPAALLTPVLHSTCLDAKYFSICTAAVPHGLIRAVRPIEGRMCWICTPYAYPIALLPLSMPGTHHGNGVTLPPEGCV